MAGSDKKRRSQGWLWQKQTQSLGPVYKAFCPSPSPALQKQQPGHNSNEGTTMAVKARMSLLGGDKWSGNLHIKIFSSDHYIFLCPFFNYLLIQFHPYLNYPARYSTVVAKLNIIYCFRFKDNLCKAKLFHLLYPETSPGEIFHIKIKICHLIKLRYFNFPVP